MECGVEAGQTARHVTLEVRHKLIRQETGEGGARNHQDKKIKKSSPEGIMVPPVCSLGNHTVRVPDSSTGYENPSGPTEGLFRESRAWPDSNPGQDYGSPLADEGPRIDGGAGGMHDRCAISPWVVPSPSFRRGLCSPALPDWEGGRGSAAHCRPQGP